jgi:hypothetical protein
MTCGKWWYIPTCQSSADIDENTGDFGPIPDGKVVMEDYAARAAAGNFIKRVSRFVNYSV